jgi:hypothetical protein
MIVFLNSFVCSIRRPWITVFMGCLLLSSCAALEGAQEAVDAVQEFRKGLADPVYPDPLDLSGGDGEVDEADEADEVDEDGGSYSEEELKSSAHPCPNDPSGGSTQYYLYIAHEHTYHASLLEYSLSVTGDNSITLNVMNNGSGSSVFTDTSSYESINFSVKGWMGSPECRFIGTVRKDILVSGTCIQVGNAGKLHLSIQEDFREKFIAYQCPNIDPIEVPFPHSDFHPPFEKEFWLTSGSKQTEVNDVSLPFNIHIRDEYMWGLYTMSLK